VIWYITSEAVQQEMARYCVTGFSSGPIADYRQLFTDAEDLTFRSVTGHVAQCTAETHYYMLYCFVSFKIEIQCLQCI